MALIAMCVGGVVGKYLPVERLLWLVYKALTHSPRVLWRASAQSWDRELSDRRHWVSRDSFNIRCGKQSSKQAINRTSKQTQANSQANTKASERTSNLARQQTRERTYKRTNNHANKHPHKQKTRMTSLGLQLARPRFHRFSNKLSLKNDRFGVAAGQAQNSLIFNQIIIEE